MRSSRALAGCLLLLAGACAGARAPVASPGELPVLQRRFEVANVATAGPARCALLRDAAGLRAWLGELPIAAARVPWPFGDEGDDGGDHDSEDGAGGDVLVVLTEDVDGTEVWLATEEGVDVVTLAMAAPSDRVAAPSTTWRLHVLVLERRRNQLAVVLREAEARGERTLAVFAR